MPEPNATWTHRGSIVPASDWLMLATRGNLAEQARFALAKVGSPNKTGTLTQD